MPGAVTCCSGGLLEAARATGEVARAGRIRVTSGDPRDRLARRGRRPRAESRTPAAAPPPLTPARVRCGGVAAIATAALLACAVLASHPSAASAAAKSCQRDGAKLVVADHAVRVVSIREKPSKGATRVDRMLGCWVATGRRFTLFRERDFGADERQSTEWEIVGGRFVGAKRMFATGVSSGAGAESFDLRARRRLATSRRCDSFASGDAKGIQDVAFLPCGGMAYACGQLWLQNPAKGEVQLEPPGTDVSQLAVSKNSIGVPLLYWTVGSAAGPTVKTLALLR